MREYIRTGGRGSGKTYATMTEIHDLTIHGRPSILVVFPSVDYARWWFDEWILRFPHIPMPHYTTIQNTLKIRGRRYDNVFIENLDKDQGWRSDKVQEILFRLAPDGEITYIYDHNWDNSSAHTFSEYPPRVETPVKLPGRLRRFLKRSNPELDGT